MLEDWWKNFLLKKYEHWTTFCKSLWTTGSIVRIVMIDIKMCRLYVVLVLPGSVETQLGRSGKIFNLFVEYSFLFPVVQKV